MIRNSKKALTEYTILLEKAQKVGNTELIKKITEEIEITRNKLKQYEEKLKNLGPNSKGDDALDEI